jgi:dTDP-4-amino-4,6-dideoxy-D-glucose acyltransferase
MTEFSSPQFDYSRLNKCGTNVFISAKVEIRRPHLVSVGNHVAIDSGTYITTQARIGDYTHISPYTTVIGGAKSKIIVEDFVTIGTGTKILAGSDRFLGDGFTSVTVPEEFRDTVDFTTVSLKRFSGIGANAVIMPGVTIAEGSVIGACSLVTKDTEPWTIYMGSPAKPFKVRPHQKMLDYAKQLGY